MFGFKIYFLKKFLDRSASFFGQQTHEHVKALKKCCPEAKKYLFFYSFLRKTCDFCLQTAFFDGFNVLMSFLAQK